jgi:hypothetical protein
VEHLGDFLRLLAFWDVLEAEMSGGFGVFAFALVVHIASPEKITAILGATGGFVLAGCAVRRGRA